MSTPEDCAKNSPDDQTAGGEVDLLRRIPPMHFYFDHRLGRARPSSAAFEDDSDGDPMSVYRDEIIASEGGTVERVMVGHEGFGLVALAAYQFRARQQTVFSDPLAAESSHSKVCGPTTASNRRWFAKQAEWTIPPH